jgi:hypothetical protein
MAANPSQLDAQIVKHIDSLMPDINRVVVAVNEYYHLTCDPGRRHPIPVLNSGATAAPYLTLGLRPHHGAEEAKVRALCQEEDIRLNVREDSGGWGVEWKKLNKINLGNLAHRVETWVIDLRGKQLDAAIGQKAGDLAEDVDQRVQRAADEAVSMETLWLHIVRKSRTVPRTLQGASLTPISRELDQAVGEVARLIDNSVEVVDARRRNSFWDHLLQASKTAGRPLKSQAASPSMF